MSEEPSTKRGRRLKQSRKPAHGLGQVPGNLEFIGTQYIEEAYFRTLEYNESDFQSSIEKGDFSHAPKSELNQWYDVVGLHSLSMIQKIGKQFRLHPLVMEDILNTGQRPRIEVHQDYIYVVLRMLQIEKDSQELRSEQISLVIGDGWLLSFQEREVDSFATIRTRVESGAGRIRRKGTDYLGFSLIDAIVDQYYLVLEDLGDRIERLEEELFESHDNNHLITLQGMKREVIALRKSIWPLREAINNLSKVESEIISRDSLVYFRDAYDHTIQIIDTIESYRDIIGGVQDLYLSVVNNKMNEVMKMLALISTIFLPLTLMAGIYGMNFKVMPELEWEWGYPALMVAMLGVGIGMFFYFKSRKWL